MKPIIHFYSSSDDLAISYLLKYPLSLLVNQNDSIDHNAKKIQEFINCDTKLNNTVFSPSEVYYKNTPEFNANEIMRLIYGE
jgi:hypothetical protein